MAGAFPNQLADVETAGSERPKCHPRLHWLRFLRFLRILLTSRWLEKAEHGTKGTWNTSNVTQDGRWWLNHVVSLYWIPSSTRVGSWELQYRPFCRGLLCSHSGARKMLRSETFGLLQAGMVPLTTSFSPQKTQKWANTNNLHRNWPNSLPRPNIWSSPPMWSTQFSRVRKNLKIKKLRYRENKKQSLYETKFGKVRVNAD